MFSPFRANDWLFSLRGFLPPLKRFKNVLIIIWSVLIRPRLGSSSIALTWVSLCLCFCNNSLIEPLNSERQLSLHSSGGFRGHTRRVPLYGPKFSRFHAVFRKISQNHMLAPHLNGWRPLLQVILEPPLYNIPTPTYSSLIVNYS